MLSTQISSKKEGGSRVKRKPNRLIWITSVVTPTPLNEHRRTGVCNALAQGRQEFKRATSLLPPAAAGSLEPTAGRARMDTPSKALSTSSLSSRGTSGRMSRASSVFAAADYNGCSSPRSTASRNFSSASLSGDRPSAYPPLSVDKTLLTPLHLDIDLSYQAMKNREKEEIKVLNNQFVALIKQVQGLELQNKMLETRWDFLKDQDSSCSEVDIKCIYDEYMGRMEQEMKSIDQEKEELESKLTKVLDSMDDFRAKYEGEMQLRSSLEYTFMELKKDLDAGSLHRTELEVKLNGLQEHMELKKSVYEQELQELLEEVKDISVVLGIDSRCNLDLHSIVEEVRAHYEALAVRSWKEAEAHIWSKLNEGVPRSTTYGNHLFNSRREIADLNIRIQKLRSCIVSLKSQCLSLEESIKEAGEQGEFALQDAKTKLASLEQALQKGKEDVTHLVKEHQQLMNTKLALDMEILTYRKLVEGEESSIESPVLTVITGIHSKPKSAAASSAASKADPRGRGNPTEMNLNRGTVEAILSRSQSDGSASQNTQAQHDGARPKPRSLSNVEGRLEKPNQEK
ncbi:PREDICTED: keratin, type II cytoskeletal 80-like [Gavialis gangeticus]|uniref:keratin, type II cytoskeletal 80-like n=1 Tax=Gavialis gangeticus TaxID=94835 RepID=UPI00092F5805|nr:PREDICTED: keratin, type II cytoskeletal 80-like [Gavialis gangeticus]